MERWLEAELPTSQTTIRVRKPPRRTVKIKREYIWIGSVAAGMLFLFLLFGVVLRFRTTEGTLVVEVSQPGAEVTVDGKTITIATAGDKQPVQVQVVEGKHTLKVTKGGFETFTKEFATRSGEKEAVRVELTRKEPPVAVETAKPAPVTPPAAASPAVSAIPPAAAPPAVSATPPVAASPLVSATPPVAPPDAAKAQENQRQGTEQPKAADEAAGASDSVTFRTKRPAPADFDGWTFFWLGPALAEGATINYEVRTDQGELWFRYFSPFRPSPGQNIRSGFRPGFPQGQGDLRKLQSKNIVVRFWTSQGKIEFPAGMMLTFEFYNNGQTIQNVEGELWKKSGEDRAVERPTTLADEAADASDSVTFRTKRPAPAEFDGWTFFWLGPAFAEGARINYEVRTDQGKLWFRYSSPFRPSPGQNIRSDFRPGFPQGQGDLRKLQGKNIVVRFSTSQGEIKFPAGMKTNFEFYKNGKKIRTVKGVRKDG